jgi:hypothetical protein
MTNTLFSAACTLATAALLSLGASASHAASTATLDCTLHFQLKGWSAIYKRADGSGTVQCSDGTSLTVTVKVRGVGATVGKSQIDNGTGKITNMRAINEVLGSYAQSEVHAGLLKSGSAQLLTKGTVSLALAGAGEGIDLGVEVGEFTIEPAK